MNNKVCPWALKSKELKKYHDEEWGKISKSENITEEVKKEALKRVEEAQINGVSYL